MPTLRYSYIYPPEDLPGYTLLRPMASCIATNVYNGKSVPFVGLVDSGADMVSLSDSLLQDLEIKKEDLEEKSSFGVGNSKVVSWECDFVKISFLSVPGFIEHFPNGADPVPLHFTAGVRNLLGQHLFLDLCRVCFDGPNKETHIDF